MSTGSLRDQISRSKTAVNKQESNKTDNRFKKTLKQASDQRKQFPMRLDQELYEELQIIRVRTKINVNTMMVAAARRIVDEFEQSGNLNELSPYLDEN